MDNIQDQQTDQTQQQPQAPIAMGQIPAGQAPSVPEEPAAPPPHHGPIAGILSALVGHNTVHGVDAQGNITTQQVPSKPGDAFRRILAGALVGMGAGAAAESQGRPGAGLFGGMGAGATAVMNRQVAADQLERQNLQRNFENTEQQKLNQATIAHLNAETASLTWQGIRWNAEVSEKQADKINELNSMVASDPSNKDFGSYSSFDDFLQKHQEVAPDIANLQAQGRIQVVPEFNEGNGGIVKSLHIYEINPQWASQTNEKPFTFSVPTGVGKEQDITIPAHGMTNGDIAKTQLALFTKEMESGLAKTDQGRHIQMFLQANNLPDTSANRLKGENDYIQKTRIAPAEVRIQGMAAARGVSMLDTKNGNAPVEISMADVNAANKNEPGRYIPASQGAKALQQTALIEDLRGGIGQVRDSLKAMSDQDFSFGDRALISGALKSRDPRSAVSALIGGQLRGALSPNQQDYLINLAVLEENAMAMRSVLGAGQGSDDLRSAILATIPGGQTPSKDFASKQLDKFEGVLNRLEKGVPKVSLPGGNAPTQAGTQQTQQPAQGGQERPVLVDGKIVGYTTDGVNMRPAQ